METEYVGLTHNEVALIRTVVYSTLATGLIAGVDNAMYTLTDKGADELVELYEKLAVIDLTLTD